MPLKRASIALLPGSAVTVMRSMRWTAARARSGLLTAIPSRLDARDGLRGPAYILGSGRSGTTALGRALGFAPGIRYLFEPVDRWYSVLPETDYSGVFDPSRSRCVLRADSVDDALRRRFRRVFRSALAGDRQFLEKTPINAFRIGFLDAIDPRARYIEIRRDGTEVIQSILDRSARHDYRLIGRNFLNDWWGVDDCKWRALSEDLAKSPEFEIEPEFLTPDADFAVRAAVEWIASIEAVDRAAAMLDARLHRVAHGDLSARPEETLAGVARFLGVREGDWIRDAAALLRRFKHASPKPLVLPRALARRLNRWNEQLGFPGRAIDATE
jgi:hypothetical protein